jgi:hypothetical protein
MKDILDFAADHPVVTVLVVWSLCSVFKMPFWALKRFFRSQNIKRHGWPQAPMDADGDIVHPKAADS